MYEQVEVQGIKTERVTVEVTIKSCFEVVKDKAQKLVGIDPDHWIDDNGYICVEQHTSHSWTERLGQATEEQIEVLAALRKIQNLLTQRS